MKKIFEDKKLVVVFSIIIIIILVFGVGPLFISMFMKSVEKKEPVGKLQTVPLMAQVKGKISITDEKVVLTGVENKKYILVGNKEEELRKLEGKEISVFGNIMKADPLSIEGRLVRFNIDVQKYGENLELGKKVSENEFAKIKEKIEQKNKFRDEILAKLNKKAASFEVLKGKIVIETKEVVKGGPKIDYLILSNDIGDRYVLVGPLSDKIRKSYKEYSGKTLVLLGEISLPTRAYPIIETNLITFIVREIYDEDLKSL